MANEETNKQNPGAQQGNTNKPEDLGNRSYAGSTSTNLDKSRLQTVESNDMDDTGTGSTGRSGVPANKDMASNKTGIGPDENSEIDAGYTRTAAFDEPREKQPDKTWPAADKGDMGKKGSMQDAFSKEEGYFTMDEDENAIDPLKKGDNESTLGNP